VPLADRVPEAFDSAPRALLPRGEAGVNEPAHDAPGGSFTPASPLGHGPLRGPSNACLSLLPASFLRTSALGVSLRDPFPCVLCLLSARVDQSGN